MKFLFIALLTSFSLLAQTTSSIEGNAISVATKLKTVKTSDFDELIKKFEESLKSMSYIYSIERVKEKKIKETKEMSQKEVSYYIITHFPNYDYAHITLDYTYNKCKKTEDSESEDDDDDKSKRTKSNCNFSLVITPKDKISFLNDSYEFSKNTFKKDFVNSSITLSCSSDSCNIAQSFTVKNLKLVTWVQKAAKATGLNLVPNAEQVLKVTQRSLVEFNQKFEQIITQ